MTASQSLLVRHLGTVDYRAAWEAMQRFTEQRDTTIKDELWLLQHPPVFTQGQAGKAEHILAAGNIPVIQVDRGGQVTYHGPGQLVGYLLIDLRRLNMGVRDLVTCIEKAIVSVLASLNIDASPRADAPGVYVNRQGVAGAKIAQLGLRVRRGCTFHGLSLNVDMDMEPFQRINPCGHAGMEVTSLKQQCEVVPSLEAVSDKLVACVKADLAYTAVEHVRDGQLPG